MLIGCEISLILSL